MSSPPYNPLAARAAPSVLAPVAAGERIHVLDVLRGVALYGVLLSNMVWWFSGYGDLESETAAHLPTAAFDPFVLEVLSFFVSLKFISIFSFLFGVGFALQMGRARERGAEVTPLYVRRMLWLLLFGIAHMLFLWYGDILHLYAVLGLLLIGWVSRSNRTLVGWGLAFTLLVPTAIKGTIWGLPLLSGGAVDPTIAFGARWEAVETLRTAAYKYGTYPDILRVHLAELWAWFTTDDALTTGVASFGLFLLGLWAGRSGLLIRASTGQTDRDRTPFRRGLTWGLVLGVVCNGIVFADDYFPMLLAESWAVKVALEALWRVGVVALALSYVCGVVLLFRRAAWRRPLYLFAPVGRMALTNYLGQSVICVFLFYGWGLGWYGQVGPTTSVGLTTVVFLAQAGFSWWWLRRFRFGPAEWVWRSLTYGRLQPFRVPSTGAV